MAKPSKKVVLLIVEGICEETLLADRLKELYKGHNVLFEVENGDIFYNINNQRNNFIKNLIGTKVSQFIQSKKFKASDMLAVLHIVDMDGCLIPEENVVVDETQQQNTFYNLNEILVSSEDQRNRILIRNKERGRNIKTMYTTRHVKQIPYRLFYFSRHLEHVLFDEMNPDGEDKFFAIEELLDNLEKPIEELLKDYLPALSPGTHEERYIESWSHIGQGLSSLQRATNVPLLFDFLLEIEN